MIIVTGATGKLGSQIVAHLLDLVPAGEVGVSVRDPDRAADLSSLGVRVRRGDYTDPESLTSAFEGASQVLVISGGTLGAEGVAEHRVAIDAAYAAGAGRVLYTSHQAASADSLFAPGRQHAATEAYLASTGRAFTSLRNGFYTTSLLATIGDALETGLLVAPADGPMSRTAPSDLAEAAAVILADDGRFEGPTPPLTAGETVDMNDFAAVLGERTASRVRYSVVSDDEWVARMVERGTPEAYARMFLGMFEAAREGEFAVTDPTLGELIGREPESMATTVRKGLTESSRG